MTARGHVCQSGNQFRAPGVPMYGAPPRKKRDMTRSMALVLACVPFGVPLVGCAKPSEPPREIPVKLTLATVDRRPDVRRTTPGEDITELVRDQNAPGKEPPAPTRRGVATPTGVHP